MKKVQLLILVLFTSCIYRHTNDLEYLGGNYCFLPDGKSSTIGYNTAEKGENMSLYILTEPKVINYAFNESFIIAKSINPYDKSVNFWIIDKTKEVKKNVQKYDSVNFYEALKDRKILLNLYK